MMRSSAPVPMKTIRNSSTAIAVDSPTLYSLNIDCTISVPTTCVSVTGCWLVSSQIVSNAFIPPITMNTIEIASTSQIIGSVIVQNCRQPEAPSMVADSYSSSGTLCIAARYSTMLKPQAPQIEMGISAKYRCCGASQVK